MRANHGGLRQSEPHRGSVAGGGSAEESGDGAGAAAGASVSRGGGAVDGDGGGRARAVQPAAPGNAWRGWEGEQGVSG